MSSSSAERAITSGSPAGLPQPSHVSLRIEYDDGSVHEYAVGNPEKVKVEVSMPASAVAFTRDALAQNPYLIPSATDRTRRVDISLVAAPMGVEQVMIRDSRVTIAARQALEAFRVATGWTDAEAIEAARRWFSRAAAELGTPTPG